MLSSVGCSWCSVSWPEHYTVWKAVMQTVSATSFMIRSHAASVNILFLVSWFQFVHCDVTHDIWSSYPRNLRASFFLSEIDKHDASLIPK